MTDIERKREQDRERARAYRARVRQLQIEENPPIEVKPPEDFIPSDEEFYEFRDGNLSAQIPQRVRQMARTSKGAAREEVLKWMAPLIMSGATGAQLAQIFNISLRTANEWKAAYRKNLRTVVLARDPIDCYAEAKDRIDVMRRYLFTQLTGTDQHSQTLDNDGNPVAQTATEGNRRLTGKVALMGKLIDLERMELLLNTGYGRADTDVFKNAQRDSGSRNKGEDALIDAAKHLFSDIKEINGSNTDELLALFHDMGVMDEVKI